MDTVTINMHGYDVNVDARKLRPNNDDREAMELLNAKLIGINPGKLKPLDEIRTEEEWKYARWLMDIIQIDNPNSSAGYRLQHASDKAGTGIVTYDGTDSLVVYEHLSGRNGKGGFAKSNLVFNHITKTDNGLALFPDVAKRIKETPIWEGGNPFLSDDVVTMTQRQANFLNQSKAFFDRIAADPDNAKYDPEYMITRYSDMSLAEAYERAREVFIRDYNEYLSDIKDPTDLAEAKDKIISHFNDFKLYTVKGIFYEDLKTDCALSVYEVNKGGTINAAETDLTHNSKDTPFASVRNYAQMICGKLKMRDIYLQRKLDAVMPSLTSRDKPMPDNGIAIIKHNMSNAVQYIQRTFLPKEIMASDIDAVRVDVNDPNHSIKEIIELKRGHMPTDKDNSILPPFNPNIYQTAPADTRAGRAYPVTSPEYKKQLHTAHSLQTISGAKYYMLYNKNEYAKGRHIDNADKIKVFFEPYVKDGSMNGQLMYQTYGTYDPEIIASFKSTAALIDYDLRSHGMRYPMIIGIDNDCSDYLTSYLNNKRPKISDFLRNELIADYPADILRACMSSNPKQWQEIYDFADKNGNMPLTKTDLYSETQHAIKNLYKINITHSKSQDQLIKEAKTAEKEKEKQTGIPFPFRQTKDAVAAYLPPDRTAQESAKIAREKQEKQNHAQLARNMGLKRRDDMDI